MSTKRQKRKTKQVRIPEEWHRIFKVKSAKDGLTMTKFFDAFFKENYLKAKANEKSNSK